MPAEREHRAHPRHSVMWSGTLSAESEFDLYVIDCAINNFSISGVRILVDRAIATDRPVTLRIRNVGEFKGHVAWAEGNRIGIKFDEAPERIAELTRDKV